MRVADDYVTKVPANGPLLFVANHPTAILDGHVLLDLLGRLRPDIRIIANEFFRRLEPMRDAFLFVDVDAPHQKVSATKTILSHIEAGGSLILFPSGTVSRLRWQGARDTRWNEALFSLAGRRGVPIVPIHIRARASAEFHLTSVLVPPLAPLAAVGEPTRRHGARMSVEIGAAVLPRGESGADLACRARTLVDGPLRRRARRGRHVIRPHGGFRDLVHLAASTHRLGPGRWGLVFAPGAPSEVLLAIGDFRREQYGAAGFRLAPRPDVDEHDARAAQIVVWNDKQFQIEGAMRLLHHPSGLRDGLVEREFALSGDHPLRARPVAEAGRLVVRADGARCEWLWRVAGAHVADRPFELVAGIVTIPASMAPEAFAAFVRWALSSRSPHADGIRPLGRRWRDPADPSGEAAPSAWSFCDEGLAAMRAWARGHGIVLPPLLGGYARVLGFRTHYEAAAFDDDFDGSLSLLFWSPIDRLSCLGRRIVFGAGTGDRAEPPPEPVLTMAA